MVLRALFPLAAAAALVAGASAPKPMQITISNKVTHPISPTLYGYMWEVRRARAASLAFAYADYVP
jgi:hypothetical protein